MNEIDLEEEIRRCVSYMEEGGFIEVEYDEEYPGDLRYAYVREKLVDDIECVSGF